MRNLILLGNGFDLAHNMKTAYEDFIFKLIFSDKKNISNCTNVTNSDPETYKNEALFNYGNSKYLITSENSFLIAILNQLSINNWCDIEGLYFEKLKEYTNQNILSFHKEFNEVKDKLEKYISSNSHSNSIDSFKEFFYKIPGQDNSLVLNFNYTDTFERHYKKSNFNVVNIHGKASDPDNPIIFWLCCFRSTK